MLTFCQASFPRCGGGGGGGPPPGGGGVGTPPHNVVSRPRHNVGTRCGAAGRFRWVTPLLLVALAGCGGTSLVHVTGTLTHKGKPVPNALISLMPEKGRPSQGVTDEDGQFTLEFAPGQEGVVPGKHIVSLRPQPTRPTTKKEQEAAVKGKRLPMSSDMASFFDKYSAKNSKYEVVIDKNTTDLKIDLD
jgi:hypothetical protein